VKLDERQAAELARNVGRFRAVLLHGPDGGQIRARAQALIRQIAGSLDDPFRVLDLEREQAADLATEMATLPLGGGRRVVRLREATDALTARVQAALEIEGGGFLLLEAASLTARSRLRSVLERSPHAAVVACYPPDRRTLEQSIRARLGAAQITLDADALAWLAQQLAADQGAMEQEIDKLALYVGPGGVADLAAAGACVGDYSGLSLEDALFAATAGDATATGRALDLALAEGATPVGVLRAGLGHLHRLARARALVEDGSSAGEAARAARPPVFFRRLGAFTTAIGQWRPATIAAALARLWEAERLCKLTGYPPEPICRQAILAIARAATARG